MVRAFLHERVRHHRADRHAERQRNDEPGKADPQRGQPASAQHDADVEMGTAHTDE